MITCTVLDNIPNIHKADSHNTVILYPGGENYEILQQVIKLLISELHSLAVNGLEDSSGIKWKVQFYFSSDWKFMAIILGFNAPNANFFCPWCLCTKNDIGNKSNVYRIEKDMDQLKDEFFNNSTSTLPPGHTKPPLLPMIPLNHYVPDKLHIMLRIWDRLWELVIQELKSENRYNTHTRAIISMEIKRISVGFHFWPDHSMQSWSYTPLMGGDKEKVLRDFNFDVIFSEERAILITRLWRDFHSLYKLMNDQKTDSTFFAAQARKWFNLFLILHQSEPNTLSFKKGLYRPKDVTPYIHVLINHIPEFIELHQRFGFAAFSCAAVEKKNHDQVSIFFRKTMKDGGKGTDRKSAIFEILSYENRLLYFAQKSNSDQVYKPQYFHIKENVEF